MSNRDDFFKGTEQKLAEQANQRCSYPGCQQIRSGPSDESSEAVNMVGKAAHIYGASSGPRSRRYLASPTMTAEQRKHIDNAVWL